jgi:hypothetical protein
VIPFTGHSQRRALLVIQHTLKDLRDKVEVMHFDALAKKYRMSRAFNEKDQSFSARFLVHLEKTNRNPNTTQPSSMKRRISIQVGFSARFASCATRTMTNNERYSVALTRAKDFFAAIPKECRDLLLFLLKMALYDREWLFAVIVIFSPFHALRANCSLSRSSLF